MDEPVIVAIDIGTTKICTLVGRDEPPGQLRILGVGVEPSQGVRKGVVVDMVAASQAVVRAVEKAERVISLAPRTIRRPPWYLNLKYWATAILAVQIVLLLFFG